MSNDWVQRDADHMLSARLAIQKVPFLTHRDEPLVREEMRFVQGFEGLARREYERALKERFTERPPGARERAVVRAIEKVVFASESRGGQSQIQPKAAQMRLALFESFAQARAGTPAQKRALGLKDFLTIRTEFLRTRESGFASALGEINSPSALRLQPYGDFLYRGLRSGQIIKCQGLFDQTEEIISAANRLLLSGRLKTCRSLLVCFDSEPRQIVKLARLRGLVCEFLRTELFGENALAPGGSTEPAGAGDCMPLHHTHPAFSPVTAWALQSYRNVIRVSGPLALFESSPRYGAALLALFSQLSWCPRFLAILELVANGRESLEKVQTGDPLPVGSRSRKLGQSRAERIFLRDFPASFPNWVLTSEPVALGAGGVPFFPDFLITSPCGVRRIVVEIVGFWTPAYFEKKIDQYSRLICLPPEKRAGVPVGAGPAPIECFLLVDERLRERSSGAPQELRQRMLMFKSQRGPDLEALAALVRL